MVWKAALAVLMQVAAAPGPDPAKEQWTALWAHASRTNSVFVVRAEEVETRKAGVNRYFRFWMRGHHATDKTVKYRTSITQIEMWCDSYYTIKAYSNYDGAGKSVTSVDDVSWRYAIRPDTMYQSLERELCKK